MFSSACDLIIKDISPIFNVGVVDVIQLPVAETGTFLPFIRDTAQTIKNFFNFRKIMLAFFGKVCYYTLALRRGK